MKPAIIKSNMLSSEERAKQYIELLIQESRYLVEYIATCAPAKENDTSVWTIQLGLTKDSLPFDSRSYQQIVLSIRVAPDVPCVNPSPKLATLHLMSAYFWQEFHSRYKKYIHSTMPQVQELQEIHQLWFCTYVDWILQNKCSIENVRHSLAVLPSRYENREIVEFFQFVCEKLEVLLQEKK